MTVVQRGDRSGIEFAEDRLEPRRGRVGIDDLARNGIDALRRHRTDENASVTVQYVAAACEDFHGIGPLRERLLRIHCAFDQLHVEEPPSEKERDAQTRVKE